MKKSSFKRLSPKEFDAAILEELTKQGRVYIDLPRSKNNDAYKRETLEYVHRIMPYVDEGWRENIESLWQQIVDSACFRDCLTFKKGLQSGHMNRYNVTNIVSRMQGRGVYRKDVSMLTLHLELEGTTQRNRYYMSCGNYTLTREAKAMLRELLKGV